MNNPLVSKSEINSVTEAVEISVKFQKNWWRGQPDVYNNLAPKIFRHPFFGEKINEMAPDKEFEMIEAFKRLSPTISSELPKEEEKLDWLMLMQHYGAATRLLDWSENILVALFFTVNKEPGKDGELWSLFPHRLNERAGIENNFPLKGSRILDFLAGEIFYPGSREKLAQDLNLEFTPDIPVAFFPTLQFRRMVVQQSVFTIHPKPFENKKLTDVLTEPKYLHRFIIPQKHKPTILKHLNVLGINHRTLFQSLDALSIDLNKEFGNPYHKLWGQPDL